MTKLPERKKNVCGKEKKSPRKSEEKYRDILENIEEGYYEEDLAGNFTFFNSSMCRIYGYSRDELIGMNYRQYTDKETAKKLREVFNDIYRTGNSNISYSYELIRKDGAKKYIEASASIKKDSSNKPIGFRGIIRDVTGSKQAEEALKKSEEKYRTLLDNASDAILLANEEGNLLEVNKKTEELLGYTRKELLGVNISRIHPPEELEKIINGFQEIKKKGLGAVNNTAILRKDGKKVFVDISGNFIEYSGQKVLQGIFRNITERKQMEDDLRKSEQRYRNILENIREGYYELDLDGNYTFANEANCRYLGYTKEELIGMNYRRHTNEENVKKLYKPYRELYKTGKPIEMLELESIRKDGTKAIYETSVSLIRDDDGKQIGFRGISRDVTERRKTEDALRKSEEKYRTILEEMEEAYFEVDLAGNFTFVNDAECSHLGYSREELIGMNNRQYTDEENAKKVYQAFGRIYKTREPYKVFDYEVIKKDGTREVSELLVSLIRDTSGKPIGFRGLARLITERKKMEEDLRQSEEKYRHILENMEEGYFEIDLAGNFTFLNNAECRNLGYPKEELIGMNNKQYQDEATSGRVYQVFNNMYKTGAPITIMDLEIIQKDGTKKFNEISVSLLRDSKGKKIGFSGVSRDITERKRAEEVLKKNREELIRKNQELEESRKNVQIALERLGAAYEELKTTQSKIIQQEKMASIGQLAAGVAHEINNPMAFIASNLGTLDKYIRRLKDFIQAQSEAIKSLKATDAIKKLEKKRKELKLDYTINDIDLLVKESRDGSERVQKIVRELNRFSRTGDAEYKDTNINECIESSINIVWNELKQKAILHKDYGNLPQTKCYPQKLNQVFVNLLVNAIHAIEKKGKIKIKTWEKDGSIWVTVSDTGCGISRENQSKIFEPFFTTKEVGKGTGLGLSISYEIMQRHKGELSFQSEKGKGTTFTIRMPIV